MKIQRLGFQANPPGSFFRARALRMVEDTEDASKDELLSTRGVADMQTASIMIHVFKREFPHGKVQIEGDAPDFDLLPATVDNLNRLFDSQ